MAKTLKKRDTASKIHISGSICWNGKNSGKNSPNDVKHYVKKPVSISIFRKKNVITAANKAKKHVKTGTT
jgi:hypothetical protein